MDKNLHCIEKKPANRYILFRSCFSNAASKKLPCTEQLCLLSTLSKKDKQHFISQFSSHIYKRYESELLSVFSPLYEELKRSKKEQKITRNQSLNTHSRNKPYTLERRQRGYSDSVFSTLAQLDLFDTSRSTLDRYASFLANSSFTSEASSNFPHCSLVYFADTNQFNTVGSDLIIQSPVTDLDPSEDSGDTSVGSVSSFTSETSSTFTSVHSTVPSPFHTVRSESMLKSLATTSDSSNDSSPLQTENSPNSVVKLQKTITQSLEKSNTETQYKPLVFKGQDLRVAFNKVEY
ncbi:13652_t:CDS:2 [Ambispora gerdemannii]|uniref:13652_t:CDS:1 n=1 Tax=Ambispora gerdemannii TaxID=144530 RepID=A0A9N9G4N4_9GLOM|nr:13652_t:CDS:2 [Ambispora gerdemannii]